jgi:hypothetical protein
LNPIRIIWAHLVGILHLYGLYLGEEFFLLLLLYHFNPPLLISECSKLEILLPFALWIGKSRRNLFEKYFRRSHLYLIPAPWAAFIEVPISWRAYFGKILKIAVSPGKLINHPFRIIRHLGNK